MHAVEQRFDALIQVQILGIAATGCDDHIGFAGDLPAVVALAESTAGQPGLAEIPAEQAGVLGVRVDHDVDAEDGIDQCRSVVHVLVDGIAVQLAAAHQRAGLGMLGIQRHGVVAPDGRAGTDARQDGLATAAVARHQVVHGAAHGDDLAPHGQGIDLHMVAVAGDAHIHQIQRVAIVVAHLAAGVDVGTGQGFKLRIGHGAVGAQGDQHGDVGIGDAALLLQILHQQLTDPVLAHPEAGDVREDDGHPVSRMQPRLHGSTDAVLLHGAQKGSGEVEDGGHLASVEPGYGGGIGQIQRHFLLPVAQARHAIS